MGGDGVDVAHHHLYIGKNILVHTLHDVVRRIRLSGLHQEGVIDQACAEGLNFADSATDGKARCNLKMFGFHGFQVYIVIF